MPKSMNRLAAVTTFAAVLLLPLGVVALSPARQPSEPLPPAIVLASPPAPTIEIRPVFVPGVETDSVPRLSFVDMLNGWAWYEAESVLAATVDGGLTWQRISLPGFPHGAIISVYPLAPDRIALHTIVPGASAPDEILLLSNGGTTQQRHSMANAPAEWLLAELGRFQMICVAGGSCERTQLIKVGAGPVAVQPSIHSSVAAVVNGTDGRLWLTESEPGKVRRLAVSADDGTTWTELSCPDDTHGAELKLSPDGSEVWLSGHGRLLKLENGQWNEQWHYGPHEMTQWQPTGNGVVAVMQTGGAFGFVTGGMLVAVPGIAAEYLVPLNDGTLALYEEESVLLGIGNGSERSWVRLLP